MIIGLCAIHIYIDILYENHSVSDESHANVSALFNRHFNYPTIYCSYKLTSTCPMLHLMASMIRAHTVHGGAQRVSTVARFDARTCSRTDIHSRIATVSVLRCTNYTSPARNLLRPIALRRAASASKRERAETRGRILAREAP